MSQDTSCPYCESSGSIQVAEDYTSAINIRCKNCGGVFEFMPDFGSFSLPDEGRGFTYMREEPTSRYEQEYVIDDEEIPQAVPQVLGCCVLMLILISVFLPIILMLLFGW